MPAPKPCYVIDLTDTLKPCARLLAQTKACFHYDDNAAMNANTASEGGFTLIELLVMIAIAGVLMAVAIPSFRQSIAQGRLTNYANELMTSLNYSRSEAIRRGQQVTMRRTSTTAGVWESGWTIFVDQDRSNAFNDDGDSNLCETNSDGSPSEDCVLKVLPATTTGFTIRTGTSSYQNYASYMPTGLSGNLAGDTFRVCATGINAADGRSVTVSVAGRARVSTGASSCP